MSHVFDFKSIKQILDRQEQKADFEEKNPEPGPAMYGWPYAIATTGAVPLVVPFDAMGEFEKVLSELEGETERLIATMKLSPAHEEYLAGKVSSFCAPESDPA